jgi:hypothetical protein
MKPISDIYLDFQNELLDKNVNSMVHCDDVKYFDYFLAILSSGSCKKWLESDIKTRTQSFNCRLLVKPGTNDYFIVTYFLPTVPNVNYRSEGCESFSLSLSILLALNLNEEVR